MQPAMRLATAEDLPALSDLYRQLNPDDEAIPPNQVAAVSEEILSSKYFELIVAESGGDLVGTCYLNVIPNLTRGGQDRVRQVKMPLAVIAGVAVEVRPLTGAPERPVRVVADDLAVASRPPTPASLTVAQRGSVW
jgi:hypothetical protein